MLVSHADLSGHRLRRPTALDIRSPRLRGTRNIINAPHPLRETPHRNREHVLPVQELWGSEAPRYPRRELCGVCNTKNSLGPLSPFVCPEVLTAAVQSGRVSPMAGSGYGKIRGAGTKTVVSTWLQHHGAGGDCSSAGTVLQWGDVRPGRNR